MMEVGEEDVNPDEPNRYTQVEQAIATARDFKKYLGTVHGHTDDQYTHDQELR
jgi:hypothetical protein